MAGCSTPASHITRLPGPVELDGYAGNDWEAIVSHAGRDEPCVPCAVDLSLGAWRAHSAAADLLGQLGAAPGSPERGVQQRARQPGALPSYASVIGQGIDAEARGDRAIQAALSNARRVLGLVAERPRHLFVVFPPLAPHGWDAADRWLVAFLAQGLARGGSHRLVLASSDPQPLPPGWLVRWRAAPEGPSDPSPLPLAALIPGVLEPDPGARFDIPATWPALAHGRRLVPPGLRRRAVAALRLDFDRLAERAEPGGWLEAYAQYHGNNYHTDAFFLAGQAWQQFSAGGTEIGLRLMRRAVASSARPEARLALQAQLQGMLIAQGEYEEVASAAVPPQGAPASLRSFLLEAKGWGLVMTGRPVEGIACLEQAQGLVEAERDERELLYLLNISALGRLRQGDAPGAMALEQAVEARLDAAALPDQRLRYVNWINIARLHRRQGDADAAATYYRRAFATTYGLRTESDAVYQEATLARLCGQQGRAEDAFFGWLRAGLHWLAHPAPEAFARRYAAAFLPGALDDLATTLPEAVAAALARHLSEASLAFDAPVLGAAVERPAAGRKSLAFAAGSALDGACPAAAVAAAPGWSIVLLRERLAPAWDGPAQRDLAALVTSLLAMLAGASGLAEMGTAVVDDRGGCGLAVTRREALEVSLRWHAPELIFGARREALDPEARLHLTGRLHVRVAPGVAAVSLAQNGPAVAFKRYREPVPVSAEDAGLLLEIADSMPVGELATRMGAASDLLRFVERLRCYENLGYVQLYLEEECNEADRLVPDRVRT